MKRNCVTCGNEIKGTIWSDTPELTLTHGWGGQCKECYSKDHKWCPKCKNRPLALEWKACPDCGTKVK